jgi:hypothetical protein
MLTSVELETQVYRSYWDDGLLDIFAAAAVLLVGLCWSGGFAVAAAIVPALFAPLWGPVRQRLIEPRLGYVEFTDARLARNAGKLRLVLYTGIGFLALALGAWLLRSRLQPMPAEVLVAGLPAVLLGLMAAMTVVLTGCSRFIGYAAILAVAGIAGAALGQEPGPILAAAGAVMMAVAITVLVRLVRANPPDGEAGA